MSTPPIKPLPTRERLSEVRYEIRGELARRARDLEAQGRKLIKLNIGNPGAFGFRAPEHLQHAIADDMDRTDPTPTSRACLRHAKPSPLPMRVVACRMRTPTACSSATGSAN